MTTRAGSQLYSPEILSLAVSLAEFPLTENLTNIGEATSRVCGSRVTMGILPDENGRIGLVGARVTACAIGQAAAALFLLGASGRSGGEIQTATRAIEGWLTGDATTPPWPDIVRLNTARAYPARHQAILLPWRAALTALSKNDRAA